MPHTYLGLTQRTVNGRWLYGRPKQARLGRFLTALPNEALDLGSTNITSGVAPLAVNHIIGVAAVPTMPVGQASWPTSRPKAGGLAIVGSGYARDPATSSAITTLRTWTYAPGSTAAAAFNSTTAHSYAAGVHTPTLTCKDALARTSVQTLNTITAT